MIPADLDTWRRAQAAGRPIPWPGVRFLGSGERPALLDPGHRWRAVASESEAAADGVAIRATADLVMWAAEDDSERAYGYWRGPDGTEPDAAPIVVLDGEGSFDLAFGHNLSEALCFARCDSREHY